MIYHETLLATVDSFLIESFRKYFIENKIWKDVYDFVVSWEGFSMETVKLWLIYIMLEASSECYLYLKVLSQYNFQYITT